PIENTQRILQNMSVIRLEYRNVTMRFADAKGEGTLTAVRGVSFAVHDAEVVSLIGPTGCGKSTLLNIGSGLATPSEGAAFVDGERVAGANAHVAFMLQKDLLLPWRTVAENVMFGVEIQGLPAKECKRRAQALLANFKLAEFSGHYPHQLSGGMRQRVALARTLAVDPHVLLLDEPFSAVDAQTRMVLQRDLAQTLKQANKTALLITHDLAEAVTLSDRVLVMSRRPGTIIDEIKIEIPQRDNPIARRREPKLNDYVAELMDRLDIAHVALERQVGSLQMTPAPRPPAGEPLPALPCWWCSSRPGSGGRTCSVCPRSSCRRSRAWPPNLSAPGRSIICRCTPALPSPRSWPVSCSAVCSG